MLGDILLPSTDFCPSGRGEIKINQALPCALLADRHFGLSDGIRGLLETTFSVVVMVADEQSLFETVDRMRVELAVVDVSLTRGTGLTMIRRLREQFPDLKLIVISVHDEPSVCKAALQAGANAFVPKSAIATDLIAAVDAALAGGRQARLEVKR